MKTKTKPQANKTQQKVADAVRAYMRSKHLSIEEDEIDSDDTIRLGTSDRRSAGDDEPPQDIIDSMRAHVRALRTLSPFIFAGTENVDEWAHLNITVRATKRKDRPEGDVCKITDTLKKRFPESVSKHPKTRSIDISIPCGFDGRLTVDTLVEGRYGRQSIVFGWQMAGNSKDGWWLVVQWGDHKVSRPAKFKKLTANVVLKQLEMLLAQLADPLDAMGWTINVRTPGGFRMTGGGRHKENFGLWQVTDKDKNTLRTYVADATIVFINNFSGKEIRAGVGQPVPEEVKPITISEL
jgi:hypothetical protein